MSGKLRVRVITGIPGHEPGSIVKIEADSEGTPLDWHWRRRLKDAEIDGCCEVVKEAPLAPVIIEDDEDLPNLDE